MINIIIAIPIGLLLTAGVIYACMRSYKKNSKSLDTDTTYSDDTSSAKTDLLQKMYDNKIISYETFSEKLWQPPPMPPVKPPKENTIPVSGTIYGDNYIMMSGIYNEPRFLMTAYDPLYERPIVKQPAKKLGGQGGVPPPYKRKFNFKDKE